MTHLCLLGAATSIHLRRWAQEMAARAFKVSVITAAPHEIPGVEVVSLAPVSSQIAWFARVPAVRRHLARLAPDIVHAHYVTSYGMLGACGGRRPLVLTAWGTDILVSPRESRFVHALTGWVLRRAALITADSNDTLDAIATYGPRCRVVEVLPGADMRLFHPQPAAPARRPGEAFHVASLRTWEPNYRIDLIVRAFALLRASGPALLHLFGGGGQEAALRALVSELGVSESVVWHGWMAPADLARALASCHVSVSVPASDATSVSLLESMACGLPVVVSNLPANRQWVTAQGGEFVSGRSADELAEVLAELRADSARCARLGAHNHALAQVRGSTAAQMDRMARLYGEVLERSRSTA